MKNIAVTGISGYIGSRLLAHLNGSEVAAKIVGIDIREPTIISSKLTFYPRDVREPFGDVLLENEVDTVVHLAFVLRPTRKTENARQTDVEGMANLVKVCQGTGVRHILYLSSHTIYGAHKDNPIPLTEDTPPRPLTSFQYSRDKGEAERILRDFGASQPNVTVTILRSCPVIGPNAVGSATTIMFQPSVIVGVAGCDPPMQFVHEDDLIELIGLFLAQPKGGIYNVAGDGVLKYSEVARQVGKRLIKLPRILLETAISLSWAMHFQSASPVSGVEFIKYPPVVSTAKLAREMGFRFQHSSREALSAFAGAYRKGKPATSPPDPLSVRNSPLIPHYKGGKDLTRR
jgi:UDP-glucose 4-epimerase